MHKGEIYEKRKLLFPASFSKKNFKPIKTNLTLNIRNNAWLIIHIVKVKSAWSAGVIDKRLSGMLQLVCVEHAEMISINAKTSAVMNKKI